MAKADALTILLQKLGPDKQRRLFELLRPSQDSIAVIGIGCRFPGNANTPELYWENLLQSRDAIHPIPQERWDAEAMFHPDPDTPGSISSRWGGFLDDIDQFDAHFFGISNKEARRMDPQQRIFLETAWEALENAGITHEQLAGSKTGVFVGVSTNDYSWHQFSDLKNVDAYSASGVADSILSGRLSYVFDLKGPSLSIDTACSSSLSATHLAIRSLRDQECNQAIVGGVNLLLTPMLYVAFSRAHMMASDGRCKTFDAKADGFVRSEGCGVIILKRLTDALKEQDNILAVIRGSAMNQDGASMGLTAPNGEAQIQVIKQAHQDAGISPSQISYLEAHGTGTSLGDPIEVSALSEVFQDVSSTCYLGSVKGNIGHMEAASGLASLIKSILVLQHSTIPPQLHFKRLNPNITLEDTPFLIPKESVNLPGSSKKRAVGVSAFGFSGTNVHIVLEELPINKTKSKSSGQPYHLLKLSAKSKQALKDLAGSYGAYLQSTPSLSLADLCYSANNGRSDFPHRLGIVAENVPQVMEKLQKLELGKSTPGLLIGDQAVDRPPKLAFLFSGQGAQYCGMGKQLYETNSFFKQILDHCDQLLSPLIGTSILNIIYPAQATQDLHQTHYTQPALFIVEYALAKLWLSWGIKPDFLIGHSIGEYVAACIAEVFSLEEALALVAKRGELMQDLPTGGAMLAVFASVEQVSPFITSYPETLAIAAINGPSETVLSGVRQDLLRVEDELLRVGFKAIQLRVSHAFHSPLMKPILAEFHQLATSTHYAPPKIEIISNLTGDKVNQNTYCADYWCRHLMKGVNFAAGIKRLHHLDVECFLEVGPSATLSAMGQRCLPEKNFWIVSLKKDRDDWAQMLRSLATLYTQGFKINWKAIDQGYQRNHLNLPNYPFQRRRYWLDQGPSAGLSPFREKDSLPNLADLRYHVNWIEKQNKECISPTPKTAPILIFADHQGIGEALASRLVREQKDVILVLAGQKFAQTGKKIYTLNSYNESDYQTLYQELSKQGFFPLYRLIHLWGVDDYDVSSRLENNFQGGVGCCSLLLISRCFNLHQNLESCGLWLITRKSRPFSLAREETSLGQSLLWGFGLSMAQEYPRLFGGLIDVESGKETKDLDLLMLDLFQPDQEEQIIFRQGKRFVARLEATKEKLIPGEYRVSTQGSYLITGGLGKLGMLIAESLAEKGAGQLILTSRKGLPPVSMWESISEKDPQKEVIGRILKLKSEGVQVEVAAVDVGDAPALRELLGKIKNSIFPLRGIVHAAGIVDIQFTKQMSLAALQDVLHPKVLGTWNLHAFTQTENLDFFILLSSISTIWGAAGLAHYTAANAFLDAMVHYRKSKNLPASSVNWGWCPGGLTTVEVKEQFQQMGLSQLTPDEFITGLMHSSSHSTQEIIVKIDWATFRSIYEVQKKRPFLNSLTTNTIQKGVPTTEASRALQKALKQLAPSQYEGTIYSYVIKEVRAVLEFEPEQEIDVQLGFLDMGMDSLLAVSLQKRLEQTCGLKLSATLIFDYPTLQALTKYLANELLQQTPQQQEVASPRKNMEQFLDQLESISDQEAERLLLSKLSSLELED